MECNGDLELPTLLALIGKAQNHKVMVEFGVNTGRTARVILDHYPFERYVGVDVLPGYQSVHPIQRFEVPDNPGHFAASDPAFDLVLRRNGSFDLGCNDLPYADVVFIDGDHSAEGVVNDSKLALDIVTRGGIIIWHDYKPWHSPGVPCAVFTELAKLSKQGHRIAHVASSWLAFEEIK